MTASPSAERPSLRSQRLNQITSEPHTRLDALVKAHAPFETQPNFARFVVAQYLFQSELVALYNDAALIKIVPDLAERCRADAARLDLADLDTDVPAAVAGAVQNPSQAEALGWLFVSEGSKLGAAFLIKRAVALGLSENLRRPPPRRAGRRPRRRLEALHPHPRRPGIQRRRRSRCGKRCALCVYALHGVARTGIRFRPELA